MAEHQLDDPDVDAVGQQAARAFVPQVVPAKIDPLELLAIPFGAFPRRPRFDAVRKEPQRFPGRLQFGLVLAAGCPFA